jgi:hypothetical protein
VTTLAQWRRKVWENNESKGWHERPRTWREIRGLVVSELSEAIEEFRAGRMHNWLNPDRGFKPEGFFVEVADAAIRLLDWAESRSLAWDAADEHFVAYGDVEMPHGFFRDMNPIEQIDAVTVVLHDSGQFSDDTLVWLGLSACFALARAHKRDLWDCIDLKHAYNVTRSFRHGGKAA